MGSLKVGHDWASSLSLFTFMYWRRKWQPTPSVLAWRIPGTGVSGGLLSMGSHSVGQDWSDLAAAAVAAAAALSNQYLEQIKSGSHHVFRQQSLENNLVLPPVCIFLCVCVCVCVCNKVLLKYRGDRESFWHRHQKGAESFQLTFPIDFTLILRGITI